MGRQAGSAGHEVVGLRIVAAAEVDRALAYGDLIAALRQAFIEGIVAPTRHSHTIARPGGSDGTLLLMPAWTDFSRQVAAADGFLGVKIVTVNPGNNAIGKPAVAALYLLCHGTTGEALALIDGDALTVRRTACASALAASYLARPDARHLVMIGAGQLAPHLIRAHATVRPISRVTIWNRTPAKAVALAATLADEGFDVAVADDRAAAVAGADIVSAATLGETPLIEGGWLAPGTHVDLVGAYAPHLRESDDAAIKRSELFVDTFDGALSEGGDLVQPIDAGLISRDDICADLAMLARGEHCGRTDPSAITLFKSTGTALEDFAAARLIYEAVRSVA